MSGGKMSQIETTLIRKVLGGILQEKPIKDIEKDFIEYTKALYRHPESFDLKKYRQVDINFLKYKYKCAVKDE